MELTIRQIEQKDNAVLAKIIRQVFDEHNAPHEGTVYSDPTTDDLYKLFQTPKSVLWVAELNNKVMGCCGVYPTAGLDEISTELVKFYLSKEDRGKGIGKKLMQKSILSARKFGFKKLYLESLPQFSNAVRIYEKQGFTMLDHPLGVSGHNCCSIWMIRDI